MNVRELQEKLSKLDPGLDVVCYCEGEKPLPEGSGLVLFDMLEVNTAEVKQVRLKDGSPHLKFERGPESVTMALIEITSDF